MTRGCNPELACPTPVYLQFTLLSCLCHLQQLFLLTNVNKLYWFQKERSSMDDMVFFQLLQGGFHEARATPYARLE
jgi:hypothetical protein